MATICDLVIYTIALISYSVIRASDPKHAELNQVKLTPNLISGSILSLGSAQARLHKAHHDYFWAKHSSFKLAWPN